MLYGVYLFGVQVAPPKPRRSHTATIILSQHANQCLDDDDDDLMGSSRAAGERGEATNRGENGFQCVVDRKTILSLYGVFPKSRFDLP